MMELKAGTYVHGIWFVSNGEVDWMGTLVRLPDGRPIFGYRFRYYEDGDAFGSKDKKSGYTVTHKESTSIEEVAKVIDDKLVPIMEKQFGAKVEFVDLRCDGADPKIFFELGSRTWAHVRLEAKPDDDFQLQRKPNARTD